MRRHRGIISVDRRKVIVGEEFAPGAWFGLPLVLTAVCEAGSFLTSAPMTPRDVRRRYSKGLDLDVVLRNGYRNRGICAALR